jgi:hypothetical protein
MTLSAHVKVAENKQHMTIDSFFFHQIGPQYDRRYEYAQTILGIVAMLEYWTCQDQMLEIFCLSTAYSVLAMTTL